MRILGHLVVGNEADRYLEPCLQWLETMVDAVAIFDDASLDATSEIAARYGEVAVRDSTHPTFLQDESVFRQAAWRHLERSLTPEEGDWVLVVDADEFLVSDFGERRRLIELTDQEVDGFVFPVAEVFDKRSDHLLIRTDGFWGQIEACRFVRWQPEGTFRSQSLGGGSVPEYVKAQVVDPEMTILHLGYATERDRTRKHARYTESRGAHNVVHINSILRKPKLEPWEGRVPWVLQLT